ncbi:MAG TPA: PH domain-containing protein [Nitrospira sp.]|nr:PH domain-containing protein [Nitrospira sp.]
MMRLYAVTKPEEQQLAWEAFPSWAHFTWLYLLSAVSALRGGLFFKFGVDGWEMWVIGAGLLLVCAAILRHWAHYEISQGQITVRNGYTRHEIQSIPLSDVGDVEVQQGRIADFFGIGTIVVHPRSNDRLLSLRGVKDPEEIMIRIKALAWKHNRTGSQPRVSS